MNVAWMGIDGLLRRNAAVTPAKPAVVDSGVVLTYRDLDERVQHLALGLAQLGVSKGDRVAIMFLNDLNFLTSYFAVLRAGAVVVPINTRFVADEVAFQIRHSESTVVVHGDEFAAVVDVVAQSCALRLRISASGDGAQCFSVGKLLEMGRGADVRLPRPRHEDVAGIWYTSGTTGLPKGAIATHASSIWSAVGMALAGRVNSGSRILAPAPLYHRGPMETVTLAGFLVGATHVLMSKFDPVGLLENIQRHAITHAFVVPSMTFAVLNSTERANHDLTSMEAWFSASAPFPEVYRDRLERETTLPPGRIYNCYGITESLLNTCFHPSQLERHRGSVGCAVPGTTIRIVDKDRKVVSAGVVGEIALSGASIASGYVRDEDAWAAATFSENGLTWYLSGDLGYCDNDGYLYIVDRAKDMVITGGENVYSAEVEQIVSAHPDIAEVAVIGTPDERWGECVTAVVVPRRGIRVNTADLDSFCEGKLASFKRPRRIVFTSELPRNTFGKVRKGEVRELALAQLADRSPTRGPAVL